MTAVIVGHWAQDEKLLPAHFQSRVHNAIVYSGTPEELLTTVITLFSYEGQWVIDLSGIDGKVYRGIYLFPCMHGLGITKMYSWPREYKKCTPDLGSTKMHS